MAYQPILVPYIDHPADPPSFLSRKHGDPGGPDYVKRVNLTATGEDYLAFEGVTSEQHVFSLNLHVVAPGILRVFLSDPSLSHQQRVTFAHHDIHPPSATILEHGDQSLRWKTGEMCVEVNFDPFNLTIYNAQGRLLFREAHEECDPPGRLRVLPLGKTTFEGGHVAFHETFFAAPDEHFYGFGEKFTDFDKRGQILEMWNYDASGTFSERSYKNVPFFMSTRGYGIFVDSVTPTHFDMAASNASVASFIVPDTALDYYIIAGPDLKTIVSRYADLVGHPTLPPKWAFGFWISSGFEADSSTQALDRAKQLREHEIPCDVIHLDCYWQRFGHWTNFQWDEEAFPHPQEFVAKLKALHFRTCLWINSYISIEDDLFSYARERGYLLKMPSGQPAIIDAWFGFHPPVGIIDFTNPDAVCWFTELLRPLLRMGIDTFKTDFGEGVPADSIAYNGMHGTQLHNLYPLLYNDIVSNLVFEETGTRLVWGRSTFAGGQRHAVQWGGDTSSTDQGLAATLRGGLSIGMCGHGFWSHDIGGFNRQPTPELFARWSQFGMLSPIARAHGMTSRLPWDFGNEAESIFRQYAQLRYHLLPYIYSYAREAVSTGLPLLRAMVLEYPNDPTTYTLDLQYFLGSELLVAPLFDDTNCRSVYFPAGDWIDYWTNEIIHGPQMRQVMASANQMPLYVRDNACIPTLYHQEWIEDGPFQNVQFQCYLHDTGQFILHDDDGDTSLTMTRKGDKLQIQIVSSKQAIKFHLVALPDMVAIDSIWYRDSQLHCYAHDEPLPRSGSWWIRQPDGGIDILIDQGSALE
jgi:alpha-D-xyloside xylohydrolase